MSLVPGEQRALTAIEDDLRRADPRMAAMLANFTPSAAIRLRWRWQRLARWRPRPRVIVAVVALVTLCGLVVAGVLTGQPGRRQCMQTGEPAQAGRAGHRAAGVPRGTPHPGQQPAASGPPTPTAKPLSPNCVTRARRTGQTSAKASTGPPPTLPRPWDGCAPCPPTCPGVAAPDPKRSQRGGVYFAEDAQAPSVGVPPPSSGRGGTPRPCCWAVLAGLAVATVIWWPAVAIPLMLLPLPC
jgi:hypothetical protein